MICRYIIWQQPRLRRTPATHHRPGSARAGDYGEPNSAQGHGDCLLSCRRASATRAFWAGRSAGRVPVRGRLGW
jgi:hypothetical protein